MIIDRNNYESFFIDYVHNELSLNERAKVEAFAASHPDLQAELQQLKEATLSADVNIKMGQKETLYKKDVRPLCEEEEIESLILRDLDGELALQEKITLDGLLEKSSEYRQLRELYARTRFTATPEIPFPNKELLLKPVTTRTGLIFWTTRLAAAAILLLLTGLYLWQTQPKPSVNSVGSLTARMTVGPDQSKPVTATTISLSSPKERRQTTPRINKIERKYTGRLSKKTPQSPIGWPQALSAEIPETATADPEPTTTADPRPFSGTLHKENSALEAAVVATVNKSAAAEWTPLQETDLPITLTGSGDKENHKIREVFRRITRTVERTVYQKENFPTQQIRIASFQIALK